MDVAASNPALAEGLAELHGLYAALGIRRDLLEAAARAAVADDYGGSRAKGAAAMPAQAQSTLRVIPTAPSSLGASSYDRARSSSTDVSFGVSAPVLPSLAGPALAAPGGPGSASAGTGMGGMSSTPLWATAGAPSTAVASAPYQGPARRQSSAPPEPPSHPILGSSLGGPHASSSLHSNSSHALAPRQTYLTHGHGQGQGGSTVSMHHAEAVSGRGSAAPSPPRLGAATGDGGRSAGHAATHTTHGGDREGQGVGASSVVAHITLSDLQSPPPKQAGLGSRQPGATWAPSVEQPSLAMAHAAAMAAAAATGAPLPSSLADLPIPPPLPVPAELQQLLQLAASLPVPAAGSVPRAGGQVDRAEQQRQQDAQRAGMASRVSPERKAGSPRAKGESLGMSLLRQATQQQSQPQATTQAPRTPAAAPRKSMPPIALDVTILPAPLSKSQLGGRQAGGGGAAAPLTPAQVFDREQRRVILIAEVSVSHPPTPMAAGGGAQVDASALGDGGSPGGGAKRVGTIEVRKGDTGMEAAYSLAHKFVMKHQLAGLGPEHVIRIAKAIHRALDAALQAEARAEEDVKKRANAEVVEAYRGRRTAVQPFSLQTMELAETRSKAAASTTSIPAAQATGAPMPGSSGAVPGPRDQEKGERLKAVDVNARRGALLAKLHVEVAPGRTGVISIRAEDDPRALVLSFGKAYGIREGPVLAGVLAAVQAKVAAAKRVEATAPVVAADSESTRPLPPPPSFPPPPLTAGMPAMDAPPSSSSSSSSSQHAPGAALLVLPQAPPAGAGVDRKVTLLSAPPNRSSYIDGPFGEKLPSPDKAAHPPAGRAVPHALHAPPQLTQLGGVHVNMWFEDTAGEKGGSTGARRVSVASAGGDAAGRPSATSGQAPTPGQTLARSQALAVSALALAQPSKRAVARGRSAYAKASQGVATGGTTVIVVPAPTPRTGDKGDWGETLPAAKVRVRSAAGETRRSASAARRAEALYEVLSPTTQRAASHVPTHHQADAVPAPPFDSSTTASAAAHPFVRISFGTRSASASRASSIDKGRVRDGSLGAGVTVSAQSVASQSRRASRASSIGPNRPWPGGPARGGGGGVSYATPAATPTRAQSKRKGQGVGADEVIVIRPRPASRSGQLSSSSASHSNSLSPSSPPPWAMTHSTRYEGIVPSPKLVPGPVQAQVTAASMREGLRQDALERVLSGKASLGAVPLPLTMGAPHTYTPVTTPSRGARVGALQGRSPAFSPELAGESLIAGRTPPVAARPSGGHSRHASRAHTGVGEEEEEEEEEGYARPTQLTAAQRRLLDATLTPSGGVKTAEQLQAGLSYALPPPPPPPPASSRRHRSASHGSSGSYQAEGGRLGDSDQGKPLFNLDVDIGGGRKGRIVVREACVVETLAEQFLAAHSLPPAVLPKLQGLILGAIQAQRRKAEREVELLHAQGE